MQTYTLLIFERAIKWLSDKIPSSMAEIDGSSL